MPKPRLSPLELQIMAALWTQGASSIREIQEQFPAATRPAYTTVQTMVYRLEAKKAVRRVKRISNAHIFEAAVTAADARTRIVDDVLGFFGGRAQPLVAHLVESGRLSLDDLREAEKTLKRLKGDAQKEPKP